MAGEIIAFVLIVAGFVWMFGTASGRASRKEGAARRAAKRARGHQRISQVGERTDAGLACPHCGGTQFAVRRRTSTKVAFGAASLLGQAKHVRCVTCGTEYVRG